MCPPAQCCLSSSLHIPNDTHGLTTHVKRAATAAGIGGQLSAGADCSGCKTSKHIALCWTHFPRSILALQKCDASTVKAKGHHHIVLSSTINCSAPFAANSGLDLETDSIVLLTAQKQSHCIVHSLPIHARNLQLQDTTPTNHPVSALYCGNAYGLWHNEIQLGPAQQTTLLAQQLCGKLQQRSSPALLP